MAKRILIGGIAYERKGTTYVKVAGPFGSPGPQQGHPGASKRQKTLQPAVVKRMPSNPDPLFDKAQKYMEEIAKVLEGINLDDKDLDLKLLVKRYNLPSLQILMAKWRSFRADFQAARDAAVKEMRAARGMGESEF